MIKMGTVSISEFEKLQRGFRNLRSRVQDLEDLLELEQAIKRNKGKPSIPLDQVFKELDIPIPTKKK